MRRIRSLDDIWAWRADHGNAVGWTVNTADTGVAVTGDNVTAYGLFVEHYQKNEVIWSGQGGTDIFFQNELPYDPPSQSAWMASPTQDGYPSFLVTGNVKSFQGYGMGSYIVFIQTPATLFDDAAFQAPKTPGCAVPRPARRLPRRFWRRQVDHQRRRRPGDLDQ